MNRIITLAVLGSIFISCQKQNEIQPPISEGGNIKFTVDSISPGALTKGGVINSGNISTMGVFCSTSAVVFDGTTIPDHMYKAEVQLGLGGKWNIQPASSGVIANTTWESGKYHSFFAFAPYDVVSSAANVVSDQTAAGSPTLKYTVPVAPLDHKDLLYSSHIDAINYNISNTPVSLQFAHALSKVTFSAAKSDYEEAGATPEVVVVKAFELSNIWNSATLTFSSGSYAGVWDYSGSGAKDQNITTSTANGGLNSSSLGAVMSNITATDGALMLIPQQFDLSATMTVVMDITKSVTIGGVATPVTNEYIQQFSLASISSAGWAMEGSYHYKFTYNGDGFLPSSIEVVATQWNEEVVDGDVSGTYLEVADNEYIAGETIKIHYTTDAAAISWSGNTHGIVTHTPGSGYLEYTPDAVGIDNLKVIAGNLNRTVTLTSLGVDPSTVTPTPFTGKTYVGAFCRAAETEERLIDMKHNNTDWTAKVLWIDGRWSVGDIVLDTNYPSTFPVNGTNPVDLTSMASSVSGTGDIKFRIGLKNQYVPTLQYPVRYALVLVESGANKQFLYLRQGENPDYLMNKGDLDKNGVAIENNRDYARKFSAYNLTAADFKSGTAAGGVTATNNAQHPQLAAVGTAVFVDYPTQAGCYWQHMTNNNATYTRRAYHPTKAISALTSWSSNLNFSVYWNTLSATERVSPLNYPINSINYDFRRPNDGSISALVANGPITNSEMRQSLWVTPLAGSGTTNNENLVFGYYADGYFDRRTIGASEGDTPYPESTVEQGTQNVAYMGFVFYNPNTHASLFFPASGFRIYTNGALFRSGSGGGYWTSTTYTTANGWCFYPHVNIGTSVATAGQFRAARPYGFALRPVVNE